MKPLPDELLRRVEAIARVMRGVTGIHGDVRNLTDFAEDAVVYIDPPYEDTEGYGHALDVLDYCRSLNRPVWVSEARQLSDQAWRIDTSRTKGGLDHDKNSQKKCEWLNLLNHEVMSCTS
jgi:hypothetical protein